MASASITTRTTGKGEKRYVVRFRLGGAAYPLVHGGSFKTMKEARVRRDLVAGELAAGRNPAELLRAALEPVESPKVETFAGLAERYESSRLDYAAATAKNVSSHLKAILPTFQDRDPHTITFDEVQDWIVSLMTPTRDRPDGLKPSSISRYVATLRLILDYGGITPNPARDDRVKLPSIVYEEPNPPTAKQFLAILDHSPARWRLPFVLMEQTGMTTGEVAKLEWGDSDVAESKLRLRRSTVKGQIRARARMVQVPRWLMDAIEETCPLEDRTAERRVFIGYTPSVGGNVVARACAAAKIPQFSPHDFRHRRLSLWHGQGIPAKELSARAGHSRASMTLDVYSHVLTDKTELTADELLSRMAANVAV